MTSAASAVGLSITSKNPISPVGGLSYCVGIVAYIFASGPNCKAPLNPPSGKSTLPKICS
jgi:hypothetical protein